MHEPDPPATAEYDPSSITRPIPELLTYYLLVAILTVFGFPFVFIYNYIRYRTLAYRFDDKGISMSWGFLFRKEIYLTYRRIQDIHVTRNLFHRWLGLAAVSIQTASGAAGAEMTLEGIPEPEKMRDYLYSQMRGARGEEEPSAAEAVAGEAAPAAEDEALALLVEIRDELRALRAVRESS